MTESLFGPEVPLPPASVRYPDWFRPSRKTGRLQAKNVAAGLHPLGIGLTNVAGALCGNCAHWSAVGGNSRDFPKCGIQAAEHRTTHGPGTDIRAKWRGCGLWKVAPPTMSVPRRRPPT